MSLSACSRRWEAESVEDGRLDGQASASFERHVATCGDCLQKRAALRELHELIATSRAPALTALEHRRGRAVLLQSANRRVLELGQEHRPWRSVLVAGLAVAAAMLLFGFTWRHGVERPPAMATTPPQFDLQPRGDAIWSNQSVGTFACLALARGTLAIHVEHLRAGQRFVVKLPDGQLEVRGTRFVVETERGVTERVTVTEGVVELTLDGSVERKLVAGQHWSRGDAAERREAARPANGEVTAPTGPVAAESASERGTAAESRAVPAKIRNEPSRRRDSTAMTVSSTRPQADEQRTPAADNARVAASFAADSFAAAMTAFSSHSYLEADDRFADFAQRFPRDSRCEDALFLRAVMAVRRGDRATALLRAQDYLRHFPSGLRHTEMTRVLASGAVADATSPTH